MILLRHGESEFNAVYSATRRDPGLVDPPLTAVGRAQARAAAEALARSGVRRLIVSPYTRALETAEIISRHLGLPVTVEALVRERAAFVCDIGTERSLLAPRWPAWSFAHLEERWWCEPVESERALSLRCRRFRDTMAAAADWRRVAVISHWGFLRCLTGRPFATGESMALDPAAAAAVEPPAET